MRHFRFLLRRSRRYSVLYWILSPTARARCAPAVKSSAVWHARAACSMLDARLNGSSEVSAARQKLIPLIRRQSGGIEKLVAISWMFRCLPSDPNSAMLDLIAGECNGKQGYILSILHSQQTNSVLLGRRILASSQPNVAASRGFGLGWIFGFHCPVPV